MVDTVDFSTETLLVMTRYVHCFTLGRGRRAESDFEQQTKIYSRISTISCTNVILMTDSITKVN